MPQLVHTETEGVVELRLDRPQRANAVDTDLLDGLLDAVRADLGPVALLTASGGGAFCGGADTSIPDKERAELSDRLYELYDAMVASPTVLVCVLTGAAVGAGAQIAVACDVRVAGTDAYLRFAGPGHGLAVGTWALPSLVGRGRALDICLSMREVSADEARQIGLVDRVSAAPFAEAAALARSIAELDDDARRRVKALVVDGTGLRVALGRERAGNATWEGVLAPRRDGTESATSSAREVLS